MAADTHWVDRLFAAIDRKDAATFVGFLSSDASFRFGNQAPVLGRDAIADAVTQFFAALRALRHELDDRWLRDDAALVTGMVTYTRHDGSALRVPFANVFKLHDGAIRDYRIFADVSALFAPREPPERSRGGS